MFPIERYRFYQSNNKIIAVSTYGGKTVRGVATCHPNDTFDLEKGKKIAAARCGKKIAEKRMKRAENKFLEAGFKLWEADNHYEAMESYLDDANNEYIEICDELTSLLAEN